MQQTSSSPSPAQPYLQLLSAVLKHLHRQAQNPEALNTAVWLIYRCLDCDEKQVFPYLALAYIFALLGEWNRAYQLMLYAEQLFPSHAQVRFAREQFRLQLEADVLRGSSDAAVLISFSRHYNRPTRQDSERVQSLQDLPRLQELQNTLQDSFPADLPQRFQALRSILVSLAEEFKGGADGR